MKSALLLLLSGGAGLFAQDESLAGDWLGTLKPGSTTLRVALHLKDGKGSFESLDQHGSLPIKKLTVEGRSVLVDVGIATFQGTLDASGRKITGTFEQGGAKLPLTFDKVDKMEAARRPQDPVGPLPYNFEDVAYQGGSGIKLAGTLTFPKTGAPFTAAILITGSGAQDRDEALMGHKPFLVLSDYLTRRGFAVLRVDDRGVGGSDGVFNETTYADKVADVLAGVKLLKARKEIDSARIGLIGHSEGGVIGPLAAAASKDVAFVIMMAGMGIPGNEVLRQQGIDVIRAAGGTDEMIEKQVATQAKLFEIFRTETDRTAIEKRVHELLGPGPQADQQIQAMLSPTFRELIAFDPGPTLQALSCPVLALNGSKDVQVSASRNLPSIAALLSKSKSRNWTIAELEGLNHLFQTANTGAINEYATIDETIAPIALQTIGDWLSRNFARK